MEDVLSLYAEPYDPERPVICFDEHPYQFLCFGYRVALCFGYRVALCFGYRVAQELLDVWEPMPMEPGKPRRVDNEYKRNRTCNVFIPAFAGTGWCRVIVRDTRKRSDFSECIKTLVDEWFPQAKQIRIVLDQLNTHTLGSFYEGYEASEAKRLTDKLEFHYTPAYGSWLSMSEIELSVLSRQHLKQRISVPAYAGKGELQRISSVWASKRSCQRDTIDWRFSVNKAREKFSKFYHTKSNVSE